jgi:arabinofuranosyltransferase
LIQWISAAGVPAAISLVLVLIWSRARERTAWATTALGLILLLSLMHQRLFGTVAEDAFITFRYARNLANGYGAVFNPGERVEGYSNFLWMITLAVVHLLFGMDIPLAARVLGVVIVLGTIGLTFWLGLTVTGGRRDAALVAALLVAVSGSLAAYGPSGMETSLFALLTVGVVLCTLRQDWAWTGVLVALSMMTRPEGILFLLPVAGWIIVCDRRTGDRLRHSAAAGLAFGAIVAPWTLWRWLYYGALVPNVLLAKRGMDLDYQLGLGIAYARDFVVANAPLVVVFGVAVAWGVLNRFRTHVVMCTAADGLLGALVLLFVTFVIGVGGDWMPAWRFLAPIVPVVSVLVVSLWDRNVGWTQLRTQSAVGAVVFGVIAVLLFAESQWQPNLVARVKLWSDQVEGLSEIGRWFNRALPPNTLIAVLASGALPYYARLPTIDMMGLTDAHIARLGEKAARGMAGHAVHDWAYVVGREPAVVAFMAGQGFEPEPFHGRLRKEFRGYELVTFQFPEGTSPLGRYVNLFLRRSEKARLIELLERQAPVKLVP